MSISMVRKPVRDIRAGDVFVFNGDVLTAADDAQVGNSYVTILIKDDLGLIAPSDAEVYVRLPI